MYDKEAIWLLTEKYGGEKSESYFTDLARIRAGEPLAYLIGHAPFLGSTILLDSHPLIPRPETEYWTERALHEMSLQSRQELQVLDLCAGSGCIGVAVLAHIPHAHVTFIEKEVRHHETLLRTLCRNDIESDRYQVLGGNLFEEANGTYDFILTNPPYIDMDAKTADISVITYEPHEALFAPKAGFALIEIILREAPTFLANNGVLYIEHEPTHTHSLERLASKLGLDAETQCDQYGIQRFTRLTRHFG